MKFIRACIAYALLLPCFAQALTPPMPKRIAFILPLSGEAAGVGIAMRNGALLAYDSLPDAEKEAMELVFEDDGLVPKNSLAALRRLELSGEMYALVNASSGTCNALAPIAESKKLPFLAVASDPAIVEERSYVFNFFVTPEAEVDAIIGEAVRRGQKRLAAAWSLQEGYLAGQRMLHERAKGRVSLAYEEEFPPDNKDFKAYAQKVKRLEPELDAILVSMLPGQTGLMVKQLRNAGIRLPIIGSGAFQDPAVVESAGVDIEGIWFVDSSDGANEFLQKLEQRYPGSPTWAAANAHDAVLLFARAIREGKSRQELPGFFGSLKSFTGALGEYGASGDHRFTMKAAVKLITDDGIKVIG